MGENAASCEGEAKAAAADGHVGFAVYTLTYTLHNVR